MRLRTLILALALGFAVNATADLNVPCVDSFDYAVGNVVGQSDWVNSSGTGNFVQVSAGSLSYTGLPASVGGKISLAQGAGSREDIGMNLGANATLSDGETFYMSFILNVTAVAGTADYIAHLSTVAAPTNFRSRMFIDPGSVAGTFNLGMSFGNTGATTVTDPTDYPINTPVFVVISWNKVAGIDNDFSRLWVNPTIGGSEPAPQAQGNYGTTTAQESANGDVMRLGFRQGTAAAGTNTDFDEVRAGKAWLDVQNATNQVPVELSALSLE